MTHNRDDAEFINQLIAQEAQHWIKWYYQHREDRT